MSIFSSKNFLALFAMAACMAASFSTVDAAGIRGQESRENKLDNGKRILMGKGKGGMMKNMDNGYGGQGNNQVNQNPPTPLAATQALNPMSAEAFSQNCPNQANALDYCVADGGGNPENCVTCVVGIANFASATVNGLYGCSRAGGGEGGFCRMCDDEVIAYHNCGTGKNFGAPVVPTAPAAAVPQAGTTTGGSVTVDPTQVAVPAMDSDYAPVTTCPWDVPASGDACVIQGDYKYLQCYYPGLSCTCRYDTPGGPVHNCVEL